MTTSCFWDERTEKTRVNEVTLDDLVALHTEALKRVWGGKRVNGSIYLHASLAALQEGPVVRLVTMVRDLAGVGEEAFAVVRISGEHPDVALLDYPGFFSEPFPKLQTSWLVDLAHGRVSRRDLGGRPNGLILHRKELMLAPDHPARVTFAELTSALEDFGAFDGPSSQIGHSQFWDKRLQELGLRIEGHRVIVIGPAPQSHYKKAAVARHRTALSRRSLSTPVQALIRAGFVRDDLSFLDYGCGKGDDVRALLAAGITASGWDPHFMPDTPLEPSDVVNLGFVLNVIEDGTERRETLCRAYRLTRRLLAVAVMLVSDSRDSRGRSYKDGVLTTQGTFQRYFTPSELRTYTAQTLGRDPVPVGPGLVFVFRDDEEEQAFLAARQRTVMREIDGVAAATRTIERAQGAKSGRYERHQELLDAFWTTTLELGRLPETTEFERWQELIAAVGNVQRAYASLPFPERDTELATAAARRTTDLLVYLALNLFERRQSAQAMPERVLRDIRGFFGSRKTADARAREALFESGAPERIGAAAAAAAADGLGVLAPTDSDYTFHASLLHELPAPIRILFGCAERLEPIPEDVDLLKVHGVGGRVSYLWFEGFSERSMPLLRRRVVVDLRRQRVDEVPINTQQQRRVLLGKSRLMPRNAPGRDQQERFDALLRERGILLQDGLGPDTWEMGRRMAAAGISVRRQPANGPTT